MEDVSKSGRTILFVSHNLAAVENLCSRAIMLNQGTIVKQGDTGDIIRNYQSLFYLGNVNRYISDERSEKLTSERSK